MDSVDEEARLLVNDAPISAPVNYTSDVHVLSFAFLLIFLAYGAAQNLESTVNTVSFWFFSLFFRYFWMMLKKWTRNLNFCLLWENLDFVFDGCFFFFSVVN